MIESTPTPAEADKPPAVQLRSLVSDDAPYLHDLISFDRGHIRSFDMGQLDFSSPQEVQKLIEHEGHDQKFKIETAGQTIGALFLRPGKDDPKTVNISYLIGKEFSGQGYGTEAVREGVEFAFRDMNAEEVRAVVLETNLASRRVLEKLDFELLFTKNFFTKMGSARICTYILFRPDILQAAIQAAQQELDYSDF